jgi:predicted exporter
LMQCLPGINLFHFMALILVLGIGLDMGIFLIETQQAANTWLAVTLSVITSLLAFGLLSVSQTPVLQHFGLTVFLGLAMVWLLTMLLRQPFQGVECANTNRDF